MSIGVFDVAAAGDNEENIRKQAAADKLNAAIYDVRDRFGKFLLQAKTLQDFEDRAKISYVDICKTIEPHLHARTGVHRRVLKAIEKEWRQRQADLSEDSISNTIDTSVSNAVPGAAKTPRMPRQHVKGPQLEGRKTAGPSVSEDPNRAHQVLDRMHELADEKADRHHQIVDQAKSKVPQGTEGLLGAGEGPRGPVGGLGPDYTYGDPRGGDVLGTGPHPGVDDRAFAETHGFGPDEADPRGGYGAIDSGMYDPDFNRPSPQQAPHDGPEPTDPAAFYASRRLACYPGCHDDEAHAKKFHKGEDKKEAAHPRDPEFETDFGQQFHFDPESGHAHEIHGNPWEEESYYHTHAKRLIAEFDEASPNSHPELDTDVTFDSGSQGDTQENKGDFESYKDSVDQGADSKVDHDFVAPDSRNTSTSEVTEHNENGDHNFVPTVTGARQMSEYQRLARMLQSTAPGGAIAPPAAAGNLPAAGDAGAGVPATPAGAAPAVGGPGMGADPSVAPAQPVMASVSEFNRIASSLFQKEAAAGQRWANKAIVQGGTRGARLRLVKVCHNKKVLTAKQANWIVARIKQADSNYLQKADEALTKVLNEKAEEFQATIAPLQQALITIQQAEQLANPLNVSPPAGTVNVLPGQQQPPAAPGNMPQLGADPSAAGLAGQPAAPGQLQAARKRGGNPKA